MSTIASQITSLAIVYSTVYSGAGQRKHQSSASLAFVWGIHRGPVNSPHKSPVTRKMFPFDDVIMDKNLFMRSKVRLCLSLLFRWSTDLCTEVCEWSDQNGEGSLVVILWLLIHYLMILSSTFEAVQAFIMYRYSKGLADYSDVLMGAVASQIPSLTIVYSTVYWGAYQRNHQSSASLAFVRGIHRSPVNSPHKWSITRKTFPFHDVIINYLNIMTGYTYSTRSKSQQDERPIWGGRGMVDSPVISTGPRFNIWSDVLW